MAGPYDFLDPQSPLPPPEPPIQQMAQARVRRIFGVPITPRRSRTFAAGLAQGLQGIQAGGGFNNFLQGFSGGLTGALRGGEVFDESQRRTHEDERQAIQQANDNQRLDLERARLALAAQENARQQGEYDAKQNPAPPASTGLIDPNIQGPLPPGEAYRPPGLPQGADEAYVKELGQKMAASQFQAATGSDYGNAPWYLDPRYKDTPEGRAAAKAALQTSNQKVTGEDYSWLSGLTYTTRSGKKFLNAAELTGKDKAAAVKYATQNGMPVIGSSDVGELQDVDAARGNIEDIQTYIKGLLPANAQSRTELYPFIKISQHLQTNEDVAAFNAFRAAAIRNLRAMAGSKGLRINQAEINLAVKNDIPNVTDTYATALRKLSIVSNMLDNAENPILSKNWGGSSKAPSSPKATDADRAYIKSLGIK